MRIALLAALLAALPLLALGQVEFGEEQIGIEGLPTVRDPQIPAPLCFRVDDRGEMHPVAEFETLPPGTPVVFVVEKASMPASALDGGSEIRLYRGHWHLGNMRWVPERDRWELWGLSGAPVVHTPIISPDSQSGNFEGEWTGAPEYPSLPSGIVRPPQKWNYYNSENPYGPTGTIQHRFAYGWQKELVGVTQVADSGMSGDGCMRVVNKLPDLLYRIYFPAGTNVTGGLPDVFADPATTSGPQSTWKAKPNLSLSNFGGRTWLFTEYDHMDHLYARISLKAKHDSTTPSAALNIGTHWTMWMNCLPVGPLVEGHSAPLAPASGRALDNGWRRYQFFGKLDRSQYSADNSPSNSNSGDVINVVPGYRGSTWLLDDLEIQAISPSGAVYVGVGPASGAVTYSDVFLAGMRIESPLAREIKTKDFFGALRPPEFLEEQSASKKSRDYALDLVAESAVANFRATDQASEFRDHYQLDRLLARYNFDPLALANYVYNEIQLVEPYGWNCESGSQASSKMFWTGGLTRSALQTYLDGRGSPIEQCALLIYLLRRCGVPAAYGWTNDEKGLTLSREYYSQLIGVDLTEISAYKGAADAKITVRYPWVMAYLPSQGLAGFLQPIALFPWMKDVQIKQGLSLWDHLPEYNDSPGEFLEYYLRRGRTSRILEMEQMEGAMWPVWKNHSTSEYRMPAIVQDPDASGGALLLQLLTSWDFHNKYESLKVNFFGVSRGSYSVKLRYKTGPNRCALKVFANYTPLEKVVQQYASVEEFRTEDLGRFDLEVPGSLTFTFNRADNIEGRTQTAVDSIILTRLNDTETPDVLFDLAKSDRPLDLIPQIFEREIRKNNLRLSLSDIGMRRIERKRYLSDWGDFPAPALVGYPGPDYAYTVWPDLRSEGLWYNTAKLTITSGGQTVSTGELPWCDLLSRRLFVQTAFNGQRLFYMGALDYTRDTVAGRTKSGVLAPLYENSLPTNGYGMGASFNDSALFQQISKSASKQLPAGTGSAFGTIRLSLKTGRMALSRYLGASPSNTFDTSAGMSRTELGKIDGAMDVRSYMEPEALIDYRWDPSDALVHVGVNGAFASESSYATSLDEFLYFDSQSATVKASSYALAWRVGTSAHALSAYYGWKMNSAARGLMPLSGAAEPCSEWNFGLFGYQLFGADYFPVVDISLSSPWRVHSHLNVGRFNESGISSQELDKRDRKGAIDLLWLQGSAAEHDTLRTVLGAREVQSSISILQAAAASDFNDVLRFDIKDYLFSPAVFKEVADRGSPTVWASIDEFIREDSNHAVFFLPRKPIPTAAWANYGWLEVLPGGSFGSWITHSNSTVAIGGGSGEPGNPSTANPTTGGGEAGGDKNGTSGSQNAEAQLAEVASGDASADQEAAATDQANKANLPTAKEGATHGLSSGTTTTGAATSSQGNQDKVSDPVDVTTGALLANEQDIAFTGPIPLGFGRNYSSFNLQYGPVGYGWTYSLKPFLVSVDIDQHENSDATPSETDDEDQFYVTLPDGNEFLFSRVSGTLDQWRALPADNPDAINPNGAAFASNIFAATLRKEGARYTLLLQSGYRFIYETRTFPIYKDDGTLLVDRSRPYLRSIEDPLGDGLQFFYYGEKLIAGTNGADFARDSDTGWVRYEYVAPSDPICLTNSFGELMAIRATNGQRANFTYSSQGNLASIEFGDSRVVRYEYDEFGDLRVVTRPDGTQVRYDYVLLDPDPATATATSPATPVSTHLLRRIRQPDGRVLINAYAKTDSAAWGEQDGRSELCHSLADASTPHSFHFDRANRRVLMQWATVGDDLRPVRNATFVYLKADGTASTTIEDMRRTLVYDAFNSPSTNPSADNHNAPLGSRPTVYSHSQGMITGIIDPLGQAIVQEWYSTTDPAAGAYVKSLKRQVDKRGLVTTYKYDANGNAVETSVTGDFDGDSGTAAQTRTVKTWYNANNRPTVIQSVGDALIGSGPASTAVDRVVVFTYAGYSRTVDGSSVTVGAGFLPDTQTTLVNASVNAAGQVSGGTVIAHRKIEYESRVAASTLLHRDAFAHGLVSREALAADKQSASTAYFTTFENDALGFVRSARAHASESATLATPPSDAPEDVVGSFLYNQRHELVTETVVGRFQKRYSYDQAGRPTVVQTYSQPASGSPALLADSATYYNDNGEVAWADGPRKGPADDLVFRDYDGAGRVIAEVVWRSEAKADGTGVQAMNDPSLPILRASVSLFYYDAYGNQIRAVDPEGNYTVRRFDAIGQLLEETIYDGDTDTALTSVGYSYQDASGRYEGGGQPITITTSKGAVTTFTYSQDGRKLSQRAPDDTLTTWAYYLDGRLKRETRPNGSYTLVAYDDAARTVTTRLYDSDARLVATDSETRDFRGQMVSTSHQEAGQAAVVATATFDAFGRLKQTVGAPGATATADAGGSAQRRAFYRYAPDGSWTLLATPAQFDAAGAPTGYEVAVTTYDSLGREAVVATYFHGQANPPTAPPPAGTVSLSKTSYSYDPNHHFVEQVTGTGETGQGTRRRVYSDVSGRPVLVWHFSGATSTTPQAYTRTVYDRSGSAIQIFDELKRVTTMTYDGLGRPVLTTLPDGATTRLGYDTAGNLTSRLMPGGLHWQAGYDPAGRKGWEKLVGTDGSVSRHFTYAYHGATGTRAGRLLRVTDELRGIAVTYPAYDARGRALSETAGVDAARSPHVAPYRRSYVYGGLTGGLTRVELSYPGGEHPATAVEYTQDAYGQVLRELTSYGGEVHASWSQSWDGAGRRASLRLGGVAAATYTYGYGYTDSRRSMTIGLGGTTRTLAYSRQGTLDSESGGVFSSKQTYDWRGRLVSQNWKFASTGTGAGVDLFAQALAYHEDNRLKTLTRTGTAGRTHTYTYNPRGQLTREQLGANTYDYGFDSAKLGVRTSFDGPGQSGTRVLGGDYDSFGRVRAEGVAPSPLVAEGTVTGASEVELELSTPRAGAPGEWDTASITPVLPTGAPDATTGAAPWEHGFALAAGDYRLLAFARDPKLGRLPSPLETRQFSIAPGSPYAAGQVVRSDYDAAGFLTRRLFSDGRTQSFFWDAMGRLLSMRYLNSIGGGTEWRARYDAVGRRIRTEQASVTTFEVLTPTHHTVSWFDPLGGYLELGVSRAGTGITAERVWKLYGADLNGSYAGLHGIGGLAAVARESGATLVEWTWLADDALGNLVGTARHNGTAYVYTPSGTEVTAYGPANPADAADENWATTASTGLAQATFWRGYRIDPTGFYWMGARYYDPKGGRFISPDPLGHGVSMDLYNLGNGDPVNYVDPTGKGPQGARTTSSSTNPVSSGFAGWVSAVVDWVGKNVRTVGSMSASERDMHYMSVEEAKAAKAAEWLNTDYDLLLATLNGDVSSADFEGLFSAQSIYGGDMRINPPRTGQELIWQGGFAGMGLMDMQYVPLTAQEAARVLVVLRMPIPESDALAIAKARIAIFGAYNDKGRQYIEVYKAMLFVSASTYMEVAPMSVGVSVGKFTGLTARLAIEGRLFSAAENAVPRTVGQIVGDAHPDSMVHLTPFGKESFAGGIDKGTYFARLGDVSKMDIPTFQADVVGRAAAASPGQPVAGFVVVRPGQAPFTQAGVFNNAGVMEYINPSATTGAPSYITLPK